MVPGKYDITIYRGSTWSIQIAAEDVNSGEIDFSQTYNNMLLQVRPAWIKQPVTPVPAPLLELTLGNGITVAPDGSAITLELSSVDTAALAFNSGQYELELIIDGDPPIVDKLLIGSVTVTGEITI